MTIEEAIEYCKEQAAKLRTTGDCGCVECAAEHEQLAEWLVELKQCREAEISEKPKTNGDLIRRMTDEELAELIVRYSIQGAIQAHGIVDIERIKSMEEDVINSACGKKDIETALNMLKQDANEDGES